MPVFEENVFSSVEEKIKEHEVATTTKFYNQRSKNKHLFHISCEGNIQNGIRCIAPPPLKLFQFSPTYIRYPAFLSVFLLYILHDPLPLCPSSMWECMPPSVLCFHLSVLCAGINHTLPLCVSVRLSSEFMIPFSLYICLYVLFVDTLSPCASVCLSSVQVYIIPSLSVSVRLSSASICLSSVQV